MLPKNPNKKGETANNQPKNISIFKCVRFVIILARPRRCFVIVFNKTTANPVVKMILASIDSDFNENKIGENNNNAPIV